MAPPKPTTPDAATKPKKKVTAAQVAFLVDRYLVDNGFHAALAAFRSDAAHLFSPNRAKPPPKGLLPLADILHDYIALKEGRVAIDSAMHAMHSLVSNYYASSSSSPPPPPITPAMMMMMPPLPPAANTSQPSSPPLVPPLFVASSSSPPQPQGTAGYASPVVHHYAHASTALLVHNSSDMPTKKRKHSKSAGKTTTASKKSCTTTHPTSAEHSAMAKLPVQTSSVAKSLFRPLQPQLHTSPCTPPQSHVIQDQDHTAAFTTQRPFPVAASAHTQQDIASSQCSIVSSKTLIVSPLKGGTYYAVERSYHVSSPLKSTTHKSTKREHVKGKLNFDATDSRPGPSEQLICDKASTSSDEDKQDDFDIDFTNLDIFDGDFSFSELLLDLDLDTEGVHCQNPSTGAEVQRLEPVPKSGYVIADPGLPDSVKAVAADSTEDFDLQGTTSVTSVRAITKRIKIVSPVKGRTAS
ncbi:hypothetical protein GQ55_2G000800 [Panicum hallii var. hallii]|uniref:LisH domain-containing protein n=1 Tax=Panicum hallii var. hallii TaxID=1504633 RepID=A0A2T7EJZ1_9POAL|nr:hypothetical protein GQ55_2G000800 [Panicum hallii var. hallii]